MSVAAPRCDAAGLSAAAAAVAAALRLPELLVWLFLTTLRVLLLVFLLLLPPAKLFLLFAIAAALDVRELPLLPRVNALPRCRFHPHMAFARSSVSVWISKIHMRQKE